MVSQKENDNSPANQLKFTEDWDITDRIQNNCYEEIQRTIR